MKGSIRSLLFLFISFLFWGCPNLFNNPVTYTVSYSGNGSTGGTVPADANDYEEGATVTVLGNTGNLTKTGFTFADWNTLPGGGGNAYVPSGTFLMPASNVTLYAQWIAASGIVSFNANGGSGSMENLTLTTDDTANLPANTFTRQGYSFADWNTDSDGGGDSYANQASFTMGPESAILYAQWEANAYTASFDSEGGSTPAPETKSVTYGSTYGTLAATSRTGYSFAGWWTLSGGTGTEMNSGTTVTTASNHTLYAKWTANQYTVSFDAQGGSTPDPEDKPATYGSTYGTLATTSRTGYTFEGWWTGIGGTGSEVTASTVVTVTANQTLYAKWMVAFQVGGSGPAGGIVFYDKGSYSSGWRYLEAWTADEEAPSTYQWKTSLTSTPGTSTAVGAGYANTYTAMTGTEHPAAEVCRNATHGGYAGWFLPSKDELNLMYGQKLAIGGFVSPPLYWSSSEGTTTNAWRQDFNAGSQYNSAKTLGNGVRAARAF